MRKLEDFNIVDSTEAKTYSLKEFLSYFYLSASDNAQLWYGQEMIYKFDNCTKSVDFFSVLRNLAPFVSEQKFCDLVLAYTQGIRQESRSDRRFKFLRFLPDEKVYQSLYADYEYPSVNEWTHSAEIEECKSGFYACKAHDLLIWLVSSSCFYEYRVVEMELEGEVSFDGKVAGKRARIINDLGEANKLFDARKNVLITDPYSPFFVEGLVLSLLDGGEFPD